MTHIIRRATADDAGRLAALAAVTFPLACPPDSRPEDIAAHLAIPSARSTSAPIWQIRQSPSL